MKLEKRYQIKMQMNPLNYKIEMKMSANAKNRRAICKWPNF
jgi:hypothetical protein